jgi:glutaredoxin
MSASLSASLFRNFLILTFCTVVSCSSQRELPSQNTDGESGPTPPVVTDDRTDLVLSWFVDGGAQIGSSVSEVPRQARKEVRVQDPTIPPENRDTNWIFLANLEKADPDGRYPVRAQLRERYQSAHRAAEQRVAPLSKSPPAASLSPGEKTIVMYATKQCPVCKKARRWLLKHGIPYIEKDIERDKDAAMELQKKGRAQGIPTNGVPVFEIGSKLVPGFDPKQIMRLLTPSPGAGDNRVI